MERLSILSFIQLLLAFSAHGQIKETITIDSIILDNYNSFKKLKVESLIIYTEDALCYPCPGDEEERCKEFRWNDAFYFIWTKKGQTFFTMRDNCYEYDILKLDTTFFIEFYKIKDSLMHDSLIKPKTWNAHSSNERIICIDNKKSFTIHINGNYFYFDPTIAEILKTEKYDPAIEFNQKTLIYSFSNSLGDYLKLNLAERLKVTRKRKNYR